MKIIVDADACPVKNEIIKQAKLNNIKVLMFLDNSHEYNDDYSEVHIVDTGKDSCDFYILENTNVNDLIITQDIGLASLVLSKKAYCLNFFGKEFTEQNIDIHINSRYISYMNRRSKTKQKNMKKRTKNDDLSFEKSLIEFINKK